MYGGPKIPGLWVAAEPSHHSDKVSGSALLPQVPQVDADPKPARCPWLDVPLLSLPVTQTIVSKH